MILLDTQVVVWLAFGIDQLGVAARERIASESDRRMSAMVGWELAMLLDKGRLTLGQPLGTWMQNIEAKMELIGVPVTGAIGRDAGGLQGNIHGDPCDRIMIATARALGCPLVTSDRAILRYAANGHLQTIDARR
ncbi:type II toxin-antitoxin system VapC family toxin [Sphingomonas sp. MMS24-J45]|uniref:type II toxin-antitoxin system VapC family toxin n=1 Tax=Sphingomonas sp. MMS24-J45 TaxID=3238806 RepID=UPI00384FE906